MKKQERIEEIQGLIQTFADRHLNEELTSCVLNLCGKLGRMRKLDISRGRKEIWAAAMVYLIARLNFLFDKTSSCFVTIETICDFFGTKKTTIANKASLIERTCRIVSDHRHRTFGRSARFRTRGTRRRSACPNLRHL